MRIPLPDPEAARALQGAAAGRRRRRRWRRCRRPSTPSVSARRWAARWPATSARPAAWAASAASRPGRSWRSSASSPREAEHPVRGVVFMGMGEPLLNYENVIRAARIMSDPAGPAIAAKAISISTAGVLPGDPPLHGRGTPLPADPFARRADVGRAAAADADRGSLAARRGDGGDARPRRRARGQRVTLAYVVHRRRQRDARARARAGRAHRRHCA